MKKVETFSSFLYVKIVWKAQLVLKGTVTASSGLLLLLLLLPLLLLLLLFQVAVMVCWIFECSR